jgi:hypothetical protein
MHVSPSATTHVTFTAMLKQEKEKKKVIALCLHTPKHITDGWSHTDTSEPVVGYGANNIVTVQSRI